MGTIHPKLANWIPADRLITGRAGLKSIVREGSEISNSNVRTIKMAKKDKISSKQIKKELAGAAVEGIREYLGSTRGARTLGALATVRLSGLNVMLRAFDDEAQEMVETCILAWSEDGEF